MNPLKPLTVPTSVTTIADLIARLDTCLMVGFGRLGPDQVDVLQSLQRIFTGTPLQNAVTEAVAAIAKNEFVDKHFASIAIARAALQGTQYDGLRASLAEALGNPAPNHADPAPSSRVATDAGPTGVWQESTRQWLTEVALAGFRQLEEETLAPFQATLEQIQGAPSLTRLSAVLTGLLNELLQAMPIADMEALPVYRWADLWTRAMIAALRNPTTPDGTKVSGSFAPLAVDIRHHGFMVNLEVYGVLKLDKEERFTRIPLSAYKVDVVYGDELWKCFPVSVHPLFQALEKQTLVDVKDATLLPTGELLHTGSFKAGAKHKVEETLARFEPSSGKGPASLSLAGTDRHPLQIAEPIFIDSFKVLDGGRVLDCGEAGKLPVAVQRIAPVAEVSLSALSSAKSLFGLLRFDGEWSIQPLAVATPKLLINGATAYTSATTKKKKGNTVAILRERASRLLRKKA